MCYKQFFKIILDPIQNGGKVFVNYNLGSKDITFGDLMTKVNDGRYHTVRFVRSDINATIQVDDKPIQTKFPQGIMMRYNVFSRVCVFSIGRTGTSKQI